MFIAKSITGPFVITKWEPVEDEDWRNPSWEDFKRDEFVKWFAFFVVARAAAASFTKNLGAAMDQIDGEMFETGSQTVGAYEYVWVTADYNELQVGDNISRKAWATCMVKAHSHQGEGCRLFGPKAFLRYDRKRAKSIFSETFDIDLSLLP